MHHLKRDISKRLLVLIGFFLVLFIASTVYYEAELRKVMDEKSARDEALGYITGQLIRERLNNSDTLKDLELLDRAVLEQKYDDLAEQNENLLDEKKRLEEQVILMKSQLEYEKVRSDGPVEQFRLIQEKNSRIAELDKKIWELCLKLWRYNISGKECS